MSNKCYLYWDDDGYLSCRVQHRNKNVCDLYHHCVEEYNDYEAHKKGKEKK